MLNQTDLRLPDQSAARRREPSQWTREHLPSLPEAVLNAGNALNFSLLNLTARFVEIIMKILFRDHLAFYYKCFLF